jgi:hypothetical protein
MQCPSCGKKALLDFFKCPRCGAEAFPQPSQASQIPQDLPVPSPSLPLSVSTEPEAGLKKRHGCLTAWLILMIVANISTVLLYTLGRAWLHKSQPGLPTWAFNIFLLSGFINVVSALALFSWKRWGFFLFAADSVAIFFLNISLGYNIVIALFGFSGVAIMYGVLHIGGSRKGWKQLE